MASETLETVKLEIRSILLSSKYGVAAESIASDYEMLTCKRLPLKEMGLKDVQSLMRAIADVAKEVRSHKGEVTYHAVCDESTAHIQKLVSNQRTKKKSKIEKYGAVDRVGFVGKWEPQPNRGSLKIYQGKIAPSDGDSRDNKSERRGKVGRKYVNMSAAPYGLGRYYKNFQVIVYRSAVEPSSSESDTDIFKQSPSVSNLTVHVNRSGQREISVLTQPLWNNRDADNSDALASRSDLCDFIHERQIYVSAVREEPDSQTDLSHFIHKGQTHIPSVRYRDKLSKYIARHRKQVTVNLNSAIKKRVVLAPARYH